MNAIMKLIKQLGILCIVLLSTSSCESFLEVDEVGRTSIPVFFSDMEGVRAALPGAYKEVYDYYDTNFLLYPDAAGDMLNMSNVGEDAKMFSQFNYTSEPQDEVSPVGYIWRYAYEALANVNNILEYQPALKKEFPRNTKELEHIKAEALFLRALAHFDLVRVYAQPYNFTEDASHIGIPVLTSLPGPDENKPRNTVAEVYEQIVEDLEVAEEFFQGEPKTDNYHASGQAVEALLARVYLYMEDWENARDYASKVIASSSLARGQEYIDMFRTREDGSEAIFRLNGHLQGSTLAEFYSPAGPLGYASKKLIDLYGEEEDIRLELIDTTASVPTNMKYSLPDLNEGDHQVDIFVLRTSEMYLIRAEAKVHLDRLEEAAEDVATIRARALQVDESDISFPSLTRQSLLEIIDEERAKELSFEGHRLFDLTRNGMDLERHESVNSSVKSIEYPSPRFVLPIPVTEINANENIIQNPDY